MLIETLLDTLPGIAPYTALFLSSAFDKMDRFPDSKHACAYLGLVPSLHQSGDSVVTGHITRDGNKFLRRNLVECARVAVRKDEHLKGFCQKLLDGYFGGTVRFEVPFMKFGKGGIANYCRTVSVM